MLNNVQQISVLKMLIYDTFGYRDQVTRPYEMFLNQQELDAICEKVHDMSSFSGGLVSPHQFATQMSTALQPQMSVEREVLIDGGWQKSRHRFVMFLNVRDTIGVETIYLIAGYTNDEIVTDSTMAGITSSVRIDPNADFIINSVSVITQKSVLLDHGSVKQVDGVSSRLVLANNGPIDFNHSPTQKIRPEDVCTQLAIKSTFGRSSGKTIVASGNGLTTAPSLSDRTNSISSNFIAKMVNGYQDSLRTAATGGEPTEAMKMTAGYVADRSAHKDPFMRFLGKLHDNATDSAFTIQDLLVIDPTCGSRIKKMRNGQMLEVPSAMGIRTTSHLANITPTHTQDWRVPNYETKLATILAQAVPALCFECGLGAISFMCHNLAPARAITFVPGGGWALMSIDTGSSVDLTQNLENFRTRFEREVMPLLTFDSQIAVSVQVHCDALNDTRLSVSVEGAQPVQYVQASFADALMPPVITNDLTRPASLADNFEILFEAVSPGVGISNSIGKDYTRVDGFNII